MGTPGIKNRYRRTHTSFVTFPLSISQPLCQRQCPVERFALKQIGRMFLLSFLTWLEAPDGYFPDILSQIADDQKMIRIF